MHEFSVALNIVEIAENSAVANGASQVSAVEVEIGEASGVVREALEFAWEAAAGSSEIVKGARLILNSIPLLMQCGKCGQHFSPAEVYEACSHCGEALANVVQGRELRVKSVTVEDRGDSGYPNGHYA